MMNEFDPVIGYADIKSELERICSILRDPGRYAKLGVSMPAGLMLYGEPGIGKTLMAECFARATGRVVYRVRKDKPDGEFVNSLRSSFEEAVSHAPSLVFLDDMDKFANSDEERRNTEEYVTIQSCIDSVKGKNVFILATANDIDLLPDSLLRPGRFDKVILMEAPTGEDAELIVKHYLEQKSFVDDIDAKEIARLMDRSSCAQLETVINEAGIYAGFRGSEFIEIDDVIKACMRVLFDAPEHIDSGHNKYLLEIAYHEAGHAVVAECLEPGSINLVSVASHSGNIGGVASYYQDDGYFYSYELMENRVMSLLAGRAAVETVFGKVDVGAESDIKRAYDIVERFVGRYCINGFNVFDSGFSDSEGRMQNREKGTAQVLTSYYEKTKRILIENRSFLDVLAHELERKKVLIARDIQRIRSSVQAA